MAVTKAEARAGHYAFITGVLLAIILGLFNLAEGTQNGIIVVLILLGILVGFLNVTAKETKGFLIASIALMAGNTISAQIGAIPIVGGYVQDIFLNIVVFVAPAAIVVALKSIKDLAEAR